MRSTRRSHTDSSAVKLRPPARPRAARRRATVSVGARDGQSSWYSRGIAARPAPFGVDMTDPVAGSGRPVLVAQRAHGAFRPLCITVRRGTMRRPRVDDDEGAAETQRITAATRPSGSDNRASRVPRLRPGVWVGGDDRRRGLQDESQNTFGKPDTPDRVPTVLHAFAGIRRPETALQRQTHWVTRASDDDELQKLDIGRMRCWKEIAEACRTGTMCLKLRQPGADPRPGCCRSARRRSAGIRRSRAGGAGAV
jgi:hypothetical protein